MSINVIKSHFVELDMNWIYCSHKVCSDIEFDTVHSSSCVWRTKPLDNLLDMQISFAEYNFQSPSVSFTWNNIAVIDGDELVTIFTLLLMPEPECVHKFVHDVKLA